MADLWTAARKQVSDFEHRSAELGLVLSTEKAALAAVQAEIKKLEEGAARVALEPLLPTTLL